MTSITTPRAWFCWIALIAALLFAQPAVLAAQTLDGMRASGAIGERYDGFVEARESNAAGFEQKINEERRQIYKERAAAQGVSPDAVGRIYAKQILSKAPPGTWFLKENGQWVQK